MERTITVTDNLEEIVDSALEDILAELRSYLDENEPDACPDWSDLDYSGFCHETIDSAVPVYTSEQNDLWYLYGDEAEEIFESHFGAEAKADGPGWPSGWKAAALYCLIESRVMDEFQDKAEEIFDAWSESREDEDEDETAEA
jgi:hypothetical protein